MRLLVLILLLPLTCFTQVVDQVMSIPATSIDLVVNEAPCPTIDILLTATFSCFDPCYGVATVNYGGQIYNTIGIGNQCWLKENLNVGTQIPGAQNQADNSTIEKYCYNDDANNCTTYGGLYMWNEAMQYSSTPGVQGICPSGWHIPTDAEFGILITYLGGSSVAGGPVKEAGTTRWNSPNVGATNSSGFTAVGAGARIDAGWNWYKISNEIWSSTSSHFGELYYDNVNFDSQFEGKATDGLSVRCIKN